MAANYFEGSASAENGSAEILTDMAGGWSAGVRGDSEGGIGARTTGRAEFRNVEAPGEFKVSSADHLLANMA